jgi:hypothetical protein
VCSFSFFAVFLIILRRSDIGKQHVAVLFEQGFQSMISSLVEQNTSHTVKKCAILQNQMSQITDRLNVIDSHVDHDNSISERIQDINDHLAAIDTAIESLNVQVQGSDLLMQVIRNILIETYSKSYFLGFGGK